MNNDKKKRLIEEIREEKEKYNFPKKKKENLKTSKK